MRLTVLPDEAAVAAAAGAALAAAVDDAVVLRGRARIGVSGGSTPGPAFADLAARPGPVWARVVFVQVDERIAPDGDDLRNLTDQRRRLAPALTRGARLVALPAEPARGDDERLREADGLVRRVAGDPPVLDCVQLGLGDDGHTASLVPGDPALAERRRPIALVRGYRGSDRITLTRPVLDAARARLWIVTGEAKREALAALVAGDRSIPAGLVNRAGSLVVCDRAAAG